MSGKRGTRSLILVGLLLSLGLAGVASHYASAAPDGLQQVAADQGFLDAARDSALAGSPLAGYSVANVSDPRLSGGLAGVLGVLATGLVAFALFRWTSRRPVPDSPGS
jgi:hypothetical protein